MSEKRSQNRKPQYRKPRNFQNRLFIDLVPGLRLTIRQGHPKLEVKEGDDWRSVPDDVAEDLLVKRIRKDELRERAVATWRDRHNIARAIGSSLRQALQPRTDEADRQASDKKPAGKPKRTEAGPANRKPDNGKRNEERGGAKLGDAIGEQLKAVKVPSASSPEETAEETANRVTEAAFGPIDEDVSDKETSPEATGTVPKAAKAPASEGPLRSKQVRMFLQKLRSNGGDIAALRLSSSQAEEQILAAAREAGITLKASEAAKPSTAENTPAASESKALH